MTVKPSRLAYIDNLRVLLTCLVILHHLAITYGAPGDWYYKDPRTSPLATLVLTFFVALNQAFFMGFFFLISAYFTPASLARKGPGRFLGDRALRLGLPLLFYTLVLNPVVVGMAHLGRVEGSPVQLFWQHYSAMLGVGPMWFVLNLLLFTAAYVGVHQFRRVPTGPGSGVGPGLAATVVTALALGLVTFLVRICYPAGYWVPVLHLMPAYGPQYATLFAVGIVAGERGWQGELAPGVVRFWRLVAPLTVAAAVTWLWLNPLPALSLPGGLTWWSLVYALCEQSFAVGIIVVLLDWFGRRLNRQNGLLAAAAADSYTVYIIHPLILVILARCLPGTVLPPLATFALLAPVAIGACFASAHLIRRLPLARRIL